MIHYNLRTSFLDCFLMVQVAISLFKILIHVTRPNIVIMGNVQGTRCYRSISQYEEVSRVPSFLIIGVESPIYFTNSMYVQERLDCYLPYSRQLFFFLKRNKKRHMNLELLFVGS